MNIPNRKQVNFLAHSIRSDSTWIELTKHEPYYRAHDNKGGKIMPTMKLNNLNDVRQFVTENLPGWTISCGKRTYISTIELRPAEDYEVIQLYSPNENSAPFAEFWRGFYDFCPDEHDGFVGRGFHCFSCHGDLEFAMRNVMEEHERLNMCPKIIKAICRCKY